MSYKIVDGRLKYVPSHERTGWKYPAWQDADATAPHPEGWKKENRLRNKRLRKQK